MSLWGRAFALGYDRSFAAAEDHGLRELRAEVAGGARGRVLELGAGTGLNLPHYAPDLEDLVLTEPEAPMARRLRARVAELDRAARVVEAPAERLPVPGGSVDVVVCTLVLCTVPSVEAALAEVRRVLAPGGTLRFLEHVRHAEAARAARQDRITPVWRRVACGCRPNRPTPELLRAAGWTVEDRGHHFPKAPSFVQPLALGVATP